MADTRPYHYTGNINFDLPGVSYPPVPFGSGGAGRGSTPYGEWPIQTYQSGVGVQSYQPGVNQLEGWPVGLTPSGTMPDPLYPNAPRDEIMIHVGRTDDINRLLSEGCLAVAPSDWDAFKKELQDAQKAYGPLVVALAPNGQATIRQASAGDKTVSVGTFVDASRSLNNGGPAPVSGYSASAPASSAPGNLNLPDLTGALGSTGNWVPPTGATGVSAWDVPALAIPQSGLSIDQINAMLGDLSGGLGLLPGSGTPQPTENPDNYHYPELQDGQPYFGPDAAPAAPVSPDTPAVNAFSMSPDTGSFLPIPGYNGPYPGADSFQRYDVPSFPQGSDQIASGYDPTNPPSHDGTDTSNLYAWNANTDRLDRGDISSAYNGFWNAYGGVNNPFASIGAASDKDYAKGMAGANAALTQQGVPSWAVENFKDAATANGVDMTNMLSSKNDAALQANPNTQRAITADFSQYDPKNTWVDPFSNWLTNLNSSYTPVSFEDQTPAAQLAATSPSDIYKSAPPSAYTDTPAKSPGIDAVNGMANGTGFHVDNGTGGFGLPLPDNTLFGPNPTASTFNGFSDLGEPFDPKANPFGTPKSPNGGMGTYQAPQSPISGYQAPLVAGFTLPAGPAGWASFGSGTIGGQPWSNGTQMAPSLFPAPSSSSGRTRGGDFPPPLAPLFPQSSAPTQTPAPQYAALPPPPSGAYQTAQSVYGDDGVINQSQGNPGGFSFDPGSFSDQDKEALASALTAYSY